MWLEMGRTVKDAMIISRRLTRRRGTCLITSEFIPAIPGVSTVVTGKWVLKVLTITATIRQQISDLYYEHLAYISAFESRINTTVLKNSHELFINPTYRKIWKKCVRLIIWNTNYIRSTKTLSIIYWKNLALIPIIHYLEHLPVTLWRQE